MRYEPEAVTSTESTGKLLSEPTDGAQLASFTREEVEYENLSSRFVLKSRQYQRQYAHMYAERLATMRTRLIKSAQKKWGTDVPVTKLFELKVATKCIVVGTLFKHMELKPNILKEVSEEHNLQVVPPRSRYTDDEDYLFVEDELQRIRLQGNIDIHTAVTGVVIAVYGEQLEEKKGYFQVQDHCFQDLPEQIPRPVTEEDKYIALVSGLDIGQSSDNLMALQLMVDLLTGQLGDEDQQAASSRVVRVIIAGNSLSQETQDKDSINKAKYLTKKSAAGSISAVKSLDDILVQLAASVPVDVLPGEFDPANYTLPQQPLHSCMFPQSTMYPTMKCVTNPYDCSFDGIRLLGHSGQPVTDIYKFSRLDDPLDILERTLVWGHIAPTAPDTLACYPFYSEDPFILSECPHLYFSANHDSFQTKLHEGSDGQKVRLVTVPRFSKTATCVLVNLRTLDCQPIVFNSFLQSANHDSPNIDK